MLLACIFELKEYALHHQLAPAKFAALPECVDSQTQQRLLEELRTEWTCVLEMEQTMETAQLLHSHCRHVRNQNFRELMGILEKHNYTYTAEVERTVMAWHPRLQSSSNLETLFSDMESAIRRSGRADAGSISNLMAVAIRGLGHRTKDTEEAGIPLTLESASKVRKCKP